MFGKSSLILLTGLFSVISNAFPVFERSGSSPSDFLVGELPGFDLIPDIVKPVMYAGHLELYASNNTNYFFWKFERPQLNVSSDNSIENLHSNLLVFWLNGGPGCSSMDGALMELGPLRVAIDGSVVYNKGSWSEAADVVFVDQPGGTGFSYTDVDDPNLTFITYDFMIFLQKYFEVFPDDFEKDIYIAGESYGGQYIPRAAYEILQQNKLPDPIYGQEINLKGILIGNGWIAPNLQSLSYLPFGLEVGVISKGNLLLPSLVEQHNKCKESIRNPPAADDMEFPECVFVLDSFLNITLDTDAPEDQQCINVYDYELRDSYPACGANWPNILEGTTDFLRRSDVQKALNLKKPIQWVECSDPVYEDLYPTKEEESYKLLPEILSEIPIVLFNGALDIICNTLSTEMLIENMKWDDHRGFTKDAERMHWIYDGEKAGEIVSQSNLTFIKVYNASHMVPYDVPEVSRGLVDIITNKYKKIAGDIVDYIYTPVYDIYEGEYHYDE
ncbi:peptidase activity protein [[Candida] boidinii]|nr:peptidase activity protein [[Candida] boidinii]